MFDEDDELNEMRDHEDLPIYQKGLEIGDLVRKILDLADPDNEQLQMVCQNMMIDAFNLSVKVAGAEGGDLYDLRMENATIIRKSARDLIVQTHGLEMHGFEHTEYFQLLRDLVEEYRLLFIDWIAGFDEWNYTIDRWGLFNPPGISPSDKDPDDDIPFDPDSFTG